MVEGSQYPTPTLVNRGQKACSLATSSAAAEIVFSLLKAAFNEQQASALEDYLEASVMLSYNYHEQLK